tara:strand:+ start:1397 stop:1651 length:255 start_codon:yes stop_codon:yes gene_type:complete
VSRDGVCSTPPTLNKTQHPAPVAPLADPKRPRGVKISEEYLGLPKIYLTPPRVALTTFISIAGDRNVSEYTREDAKMVTEMRLN